MAHGADEWEPEQEAVEARASAGVVQPGQEREGDHQQPEENGGRSLAPQSGRFK